ncbi:Protein regulator of cytokinesis 1 [Armadillidium nasatum]|uniref:Protein regulator of cytokinesis 1 n=1 Tax=Armadillidium nasatum TaxID=96803 RepID=A0A5N5TAT0_9CRUS|nr:Protein regulator of cytokinesis 1 [Armadillidium nasatum]
MEGVISEELSNAKFRLSALWDEVGLHNEEKEEKLKILTVKIMNEIRDFEEFENNSKNETVRKIEEVGLKLYQLTKDLQVPQVAEPDGQMTLRELEEYLKSQFHIYQAEKDQRLERYKSLRSSEKELCKKLVEEPVKLPNDNIPSLASLNLLQKVVNSLKQELDTRRKQFASYRASIQSNMEILHLKPNSSFERDIMSGLEGLVSISMQNIQKMKTLSKDLQLKVCQQKELEEDMRVKIRVLWNRLSIEEERRENFLQQLTDNAFENIQKLESELKELEELKQQNLGCYINKLRRELEELWDLCYICEDEKENFHPYFSEEYSDKMLEDHEKEVQRLKEFYSQNEDIFIKIEKWKEELPRLEHDIEERITIWENENLRPFLVCGQSFKHFIQFTWHSYNEKKNREKQQRHETRSKQLQKEALLGTTSLKTTPSKRALLRSDTLHASKYMRNNESQRQPSGASSSHGSSTSIASKNQTLGVRRQQPPRVTRHNSKRKGNATTLVSLNSSEMSSYDKFQEGIQLRSEKENIRSSVMHNKKLKSPMMNNQHSVLRTPVSASNRSRFTPTSASRRQHLSPNVNLQSFTVGLTSSLPKRRRSARLNPNMSSFKKSFNIPGMRSPKSPYTGSKLSTPLRNRLNILM